MTRGGGRQGIGILESKAVGNLPQAGCSNDRDTYKDWTGRMLTAVAQVRKGSRGTFLRMMETVELDIDQRDWLTVISNSPQAATMVAAGTEPERFSEDLYALLVD